jgi:hypothetical protein
MWTACRSESNAIMVYHHTVLQLQVLYRALKYIYSYSKRLIEAQISGMEAT